MGNITNSRVRKDYNGLKQKNPDLYYKILDWKDHNLSKFMDITGCLSLYECTSYRIDILLKSCPEIERS